MEFGDLSENPFAGVARKEKNSRRRALVRAFQVFVLVTVATGGVLLLANQSKRWLAGRLTADFETLGTSQKIERLGQLAELGVFSVEPLVNSMADEDAGVARAGYELLRTAQNNWTVLPLEDEASRHQLLIDALKGIAIDLPGHRTGWGTSLMQQTLLFASEHPDAIGDLPERVSNTISLLSLSGRPDKAATSVDAEKIGRLDVQSGPLPVDAVQSVDEWTTWPPGQASSRHVAGAASRSQANAAADLSSTAGQSTVSQSDVDYLAEGRSDSVPTVYKSGANRLQVIGENEIVQLSDVAQSSASVNLESNQSVGFNQPVHSTDVNLAMTTDLNSQVTMVDSPMGTFDDASVMRWLGSPHTALREKAKLELVSRGFDGTAIAIATRIFTGDVTEKLELADALARTSVIDPRPWLLLLLQDADRDVRLRTISSLGSMDDPAIAGRLRTHLVDERDPAVASRIRRVLNLR